MKSIKAIEEEIIPQKGSNIIENEIITIENLILNDKMILNLIKKYTEKLQLENDILSISQSFEIKNNNLVVFNFPNDILFDKFKDLNNDFTQYCRIELKTLDLSFDGILKVVEAKAKPRTEQEKYNAMLAKNPNLNLLKEKLNLDLKF